MAIRVFLPRMYEYIEPNQGVGMTSPQRSTLFQLIDGSGVERDKHTSSSVSLSRIYLPLLHIMECCK